jgi:ZIP family zinc transporter
MQYIFVFLAFIFTLLGGLFGLKYKDKLHLILGFTAGVLLAVVAFDIFPEAIELVGILNVDPVVPMGAMVAGFLVFHLSEKLLLIHHSHEEDYGNHKHPSVGVFSALALIGHSFLDGVGIGLGFQVSPEVGILVAIAVIAHDFSDGLNTVSLVLVHKNTDKRALMFLFLDALAPVLGAIAASFWKIPDTMLLIYLGFFAGFLLYIGAADILPEAHREHSSKLTLLATVVGVLFILLVTRII